MGAMRFELRAITPDGRIESVAFQAPDALNARQQAEARGYTVLDVRARTDIASLLHRRGARFPVVLFSQELLVLLNAGLPLVIALDTLAGKERAPAVRAVLARLTVILREGRSFSSALEEFPAVFPPLYVATVRASEWTSDLGAGLKRYVAYETQMDALKKRIVNASIYPVLLLAVGFLVTLFLLFHVVPRFGHIYEDRSAELPLFSQLLLGWGQLVKGHGATVLALLGLAAGGAAYGLRRPRARAALVNALWRVPSAGDRMKVYQLARFYRTIGMLQQGGMTLVASLDLGAELLHPVLRQRLAMAGRAIRQGLPVSESMEANGLTTAVALRMLGVGEHGGNMGDMMERIAGFHDEEITRWVEWFTRMFEPLLMAAIGLVIGAIVILMYMPIFELAGALQ
jgi:general secretion pathway protein F